MRTNIFIFLFIFLSAIQVFGQGRANQWLMGYPGGGGSITLDFNQNTVSIDTHYPTGCIPSGWRQGNTREL